MKRTNRGLNILIDKLTNSVENVRTGDSFPTIVSLLSKPDLNSLAKKNGWLFNWKAEFKDPKKEIYKLTISNNLTIIQGVISVEIKESHVYIHLLESAPFNVGKEKVYLGVPGNLVAFACRLSFQRGFDGNVSFLSKTQLISHYEQSLGAFHFGGRVMIIDTNAAIKLIDKYFKNDIA
jgi:hypothetical protein